METGKIRLLGRAGMVCFGAVHAVVAYLAARVALGEHAQADQTGALAQIAATPFGVLTLWVLAVGLLAFAAWQILLAANGFHWIEAGRKRLTKRAGAGTRATLAAATAVAAIRLATGDGTQNGDQRQRELTADLMSLPWGRVLVALAAAAVLGAGIAGIVTGIRRTFMRDLDPTDLPRNTRTWVERTGSIGHVAKGVCVGVIGALLATAVLTYDPNRAGGLDAALHTLAGKPFGTPLLLAIAAGFAAFGVFCAAAARAHR